jgi:hypothetical protein
MAKTRPIKRLPRLTDAERHKRFVEMAREVKASDDPNEFDKAFTKVVTPRNEKKLQCSERSFLYFLRMSIKRFFIPIFAIIRFSIRWVLILQNFTEKTMVN